MFSKCYYAIRALPLLIMPVGVTTLLFLDKHVFEIPNSPAVALTFVVLTGFFGGPLIGLISAIMHVIFSFWFFANVNINTADTSYFHLSITDKLSLDYSKANLHRAIVFSFVAPMIAILIGILKVRLERAISRRKEAEIGFSYIAQAPVPIAVFDSSMRYIAASDQWLKGFNLKGKSVLGKSHYAVMPEANNWKEIHASALAGNIRSGSETDVIDPNGASHILNWICAPWYKQDGTIGGIFAIADDVTNSVRERQKLEKIHLEFQKLEAVGQLASGISHDFNNLLTVISGNLELAQSLVTEPKPKELINKAITASFLGARLNQRLLAFSKKSKIQSERCVLNTRLSESVDMLKHTLGENIEIITKFDPEGWTVEVDPGELESAVVNIAVNARDAMSSGGKLTIATQNKLIDNKFAGIFNVKAGEYVCLSFTDTGSGMNPEVLRRATEPFFTTKTDGNGTGLGLSTVYGFAHQSGGFLDIASVIGNGTNISIYLPRATEGATVHKQDKAEQLSKGNGELILVVEDKDDVREVTMSRLEALGYSVLDANSAAVAIDILKTENQIVLVLSDIVMPGRLSGFDLARWIQANKPTVPIILASGNILPERFKAEKLECVTFLSKPYSREDLARAVNNVLL